MQSPRPTQCGPRWSRRRRARRSSRTLSDVADLVLGVDVFMEVHGDLVLVGGANGGGPVGDLVGVGEGLGRREVVDNGGRGLRGWVYATPRLVRWELGRSTLEW